VVFAETSSDRGSSMSGVSGGGGSLRSRRRDHLRLDIGRVSSIHSVVLLGLASGEGDEDEGDQGREECDPSDNDERENGLVLLV